MHSEEYAFIQLTVMLGACLENIMQVSNMVLEAGLMAYESDTSYQEEGHTLSLLSEQSLPPYSILYQAGLKGDFPTPWKIQWCPHITRTTYLTLWTKATS